jgi:hypothetical protein
MRIIEVWRLLLILLFSLGSWSFITLIFGLLRAGRRADEWEERILEIISPAPPDDPTELDDPSNAQM